MNPSSFAVALCEDMHSMLYQADEQGVEVTGEQIRVQLRKWIKVRDENDYGKMAYLLHGKALRDGDLDDIKQKGEG